MTKLRRPWSEWGLTGGIYRALWRVLGLWNERIGVVV